MRKKEISRINGLSPLNSNGRLPYFHLMVKSHGLSWTFVAPVHIRICLKGNNYCSKWGKQIAGLSS